MKIISIILVLIIYSNSFSQNYLSNIWYFGGYDAYGSTNNAGLDFNNSQVTVIPGTGNSGISTQEGCATITNTNGELIFYTDGDNIWDKTHTVVKTNCGGHFSSTQSAIIVPTPGNTNLFYVFTVGAASVTGGDRSLNYLTVEVDNSNATITSISSLTTLLQGTSTATTDDDVTEKIIAIKHSNGTDYWIVGHLCGTSISDPNRFRFFTCELKSTGLDLSTYATQSINTGGTVHGEAASYLGNIGYLKASPDGKMLASANFGAGMVDIYDFDNSNGAISYVEQVSFTKAYGLEFSPNASRTGTSRTGFLYASGLDGASSKIMRIKLSAPMSAIWMPSTNGLGITDIENYYAALQLAPDQKIYIAKCRINTSGEATSGSGCLARINDPNAGTGLIDNDIDLGSANACWAGLPTLVSDFIILPVKLINLKALRNDGSIKLSWSTATEKDNDYFEIQRSTDLIYFENIGNQIGSGNSNLLLEYNFTDNNIEESEIYYYRLKQVDFDGKYEYSKIISVLSKIEEQSKVSVYPNPAHNFFIVESSNRKKMDCRVFNNTGQVISKLVIYNSKSKILTEDWEKGVYYIQITTDQETITRKIVLK